MRCYDAAMDCSHEVPQRKAPQKLNSSTLVAWLTQLRAARHRGTLVLAGEADWCRGKATQLLANAELARVTWVSTVDLREAEVLSAKQARGLLGQERDAIVFDAHAGFDADAFGAVSGTIIGGGLLILLCPPLDEWHQFADPAAENIAVWPHGIDDLPGRFLQRMSSLLGQAISSREQIVLVTASDGMDAALQAMLESSPAQPIPSQQIDSQQPASHSPLPQETSLPTIKNLDAPFRSEDQRAAVAAIEHVLHGHRRRPLVLVAARGRGKTAALGIAAAQLLSSASHGLSQENHSSPRALRIVVTAPRLAAVEPLFQHALKLLPDAISHAGHLQWDESEIKFVAPDELCASLPAADLLLVDEAAAIPASILQPLLKHYSRIVFSTTTHGYEGTGRGFAVRFRQTLNEQTPDWSELVLQEPIRWAQNDPLEKFVFDSLLLNAKCVEDDVVSSADIDVDSLQVERVSREQLANDEALLNQLFGLLVVAHYRTRPNDLRNLLDGPGLSVYVMRHEGAVVATALVAMEGGFDKPLTNDITAGRRRPRGHLIPQSLMAHLGLKSAGELHCARVMRIAVHPALQRRGVGRRLLQHIKNDAKSQGADLIGASFGATSSLLRFWRSENLWPVRVGFRRDHASGEYSVMMLSALNDAGEVIVAEARACLLSDLAQALSDPLSDLDAGVAALLLQQQSDLKEIETTAPAQRDLENVRSFIDSERSYEDCLASIWRCVLWALSAQKSVSSTVEHDAENKIDQNVLINKVLQPHSWSAVAKQFDFAGKAEVTQCLRAGLSRLLSETDCESG